ncbi:uncharacterized protein LOC128962883 [Oppia nitens]|uniref:uncharacterized protein LOC128962883 n=1 Tax=Oppia nitens TaxID=1686743 RepID=UPI0023DA57B4|nr:uncharacterized protein LOC128962883 [Oppia nitens]
MSSNDRNQSKPTDATEDDDFGDFEGPEDEAPESVQAMGGPPNWVFPDLLRVDSSQSSHDEPSNHMNQQSVISNQSRHNVVMRPNHRDMGAIPKQRDLPDISLLTTSRESTLSTNALKPSFSRESTANSSLANRSSKIMSETISSGHNGTNDTNHMRMNRLEQDVKTLQTQKALLQQQLLQKDTQIRELQSQSRQLAINSPQTQEALITTLTETVNKFQSTITSAMDRLEQRLTSLETRVVNTNDSIIDSGDSLSPKTNNVNNAKEGEVSALTIQNILKQQRNELKAERQQNLLLVSSVLKNALETIESHLDVKDINTNHN